MKLTVGIVDYGTGNIASLEMALADLEVRSLSVSMPCDFQSVDAVILPGVGHFGPASLALEISGMRKALLKLIEQGLPVLGICLGFQMLTGSSEEAPGVAGLSVLPGFAQRLRPINTQIHKVPHLGWNSLMSSADSPRLLNAIPAHQRLFYFANAYGVAVNSSPSLSSHALYQHESSWFGLMEQGSVFGVQFHPEKSRRQGLQVLRNFLSVAGEKC